jgi:serine O-acetyltransferase
MSTSHQNPATTASTNAHQLCAAKLTDISATWAVLCDEAGEIAHKEFHLRHLVEDVVLSRSHPAAMLGARLARRLSCEDMPRGELEPMFLALTTYRVAHHFWGADRRWLALYLQSLSSEVFAVDIHPAARIGCGILLDHATSFVVGETAIIEDDVSILHEVTLGGTGKQTGDRHPIVRSGVLLGAGAKILGRVEIGTGAKVGAGSVVLEDVPPHTTVAGVPAVIVGEAIEANPAIEMNQHLDCRKSIPSAEAEGGGG